MYAQTQYKINIFFIMIRTLKKILAFINKNKNKFFFIKNNLQLTCFKITFIYLILYLNINFDLNSTSIKL
jgi:hypothetical protein